MSSLRDIKKRIANVSVIEKTAQSMKAISTSRLAAAKSFRSSNDEYLSASKDILETMLSLQKREVASNVEFVKNMFNPKEEAEYKKTLYIIVSSDRGLCGSYNSNVFKAFSHRVANKANGSYLVLPIGAKSLLFSNKLNKDNVLDLYISSDIKQNINEGIIKATDYISSLIANAEIDRVQFVYTKSVNIMLQEVLVETVFPILQENPKDVDKAKESIAKNIVTDDKNFSDLVYDLLKQYIATNIFDKITHAAVSEHASRLNAMSNAFDNSKELKRLLNLEYNRTRQGLITKELIEIISGAEAL
ncbi:MAG: ATP synthase F1 subunit gamma [Alphaproteobacteria bacterium]|jgi:F-type H+-transporting ATPase subunit gamma|nr:ATP synthase F1 subunit gamma [Alphaproteobacteria bacterium]